MYLSEENRWVGSVVFRVICIVLFRVVSRAALRTTSKSRECGL